jgi:hypothetical protein
MPSYNTSLLPTSTGLTLGTSAQQWAAWLSSVNGFTPINFGTSVVPYSITPTFSATAILTVFNMTLVGNVTSSTFVGVKGFVIFQITQDSVGGRTFVWPANFNDASAVHPGASENTTQLFYYDGVNAWPLGPGMIFP